MQKPTQKVIFVAYVVETYQENYLLKVLVFKKRTSGIPDMSSSSISVIFHGTTIQIIKIHEKLVNH